MVKVGATGAQMDNACGQDHKVIVNIRFSHNFLQTHAALIQMFYVILSIFIFHHKIADNTYALL